MKIIFKQFFFFILAAILVTLSELGMGRRRSRANLWASLTSELFKIILGIAAHSTKAAIDSSGQRRVPLSSV